MHPPFITFLPLFSLPFPFTSLLLTLLLKSNMSEPSSHFPPDSQSIPVGTGSGYLPEGQHALTISDALSAFAQTLPKKNNYVPVVRNYLLFTVAQGLLLNDFSRDCYFVLYAQDRKLGYNISSPIKRFLRFAAETGIHRVVADPPERKVPPAANELIWVTCLQRRTCGGRKLA